MSEQTYYAAGTTGPPYAVTVRETGEILRTFKTFDGALRYAHKLEREREASA